MFGFGGYNPSQNTSTSSKGRQDRDTQYQGGGYDSSKNVSNRGTGFTPGAGAPTVPKGGTGGPPSVLNPNRIMPHNHNAYVPTVTGVEGSNLFIDPTSGDIFAENDPMVSEKYLDMFETPKQNTLLDFFSKPKLLGILEKFLPKTDFQSYYDKYGIKDKYGFTPKQFKDLVTSGDISIKGVPMKGNIGFTGGGDQPVRIVGGGEGGQQPSGIQTIATPITPDEEEIDTITEEDVSVDGDRQAYYDDLYEQLIAAGISPSNASMIAEYRSDVRFPTA